MKIISITGGVGSGKSEVLRVLQEEFDAEKQQADKEAGIKKGQKRTDGTVKNRRRGNGTGRIWASCIRRRCSSFTAVYGRNG